MQRTIPKSGNSDYNENPLRILEATLSFLWLLTPLSATISLILVAIGMITNQWLYTSEKMPNPYYNGTGEKDYLSKMTVSGLWVFCFTNHDFNELTGKSGEIYSPLYPRPYLEYRTFSWKITVDSKKRNLLSFKEFNLDALDNSDEDCYFALPISSDFFCEKPIENVRRNTVTFNRE